MGETPNDRSVLPNTERGDSRRREVKFFRLNGTNAEANAAYPNGMRVWSRALGLFLAVQAAVGCGDSKSDSDGDAGGDGGSSGATGGSTSTGGTSATGGSTAGSGGGGQIPDSPLCDPFAEHFSTDCPEAWTIEDALFTCEDGFRTHYPTGCGTEWGDFVTCMTLAEIDCATGSPIGCTPAELGYTACQADFTTQTECSLVGASGMCPAGQFSFGCLADLPRGCTEFLTEGTVTWVCCPAFPD
jgi:hypothetical protein